MNQTHTNHADEDYQDAVARAGVIELPDSASQQNRLFGNADDDLSEVPQ